jgi:hypothetical protein
MKEGGDPEEMLLGRWPRREGRVPGPGWWVVVVVEG